MCKYINVLKRNLFKKNEILKGEIIKEETKECTDWLATPYSHKIYTIKLEDGKVITITEDERTIMGYEISQ